MCILFVILTYHMCETWCVRAVIQYRMLPAGMSVVFFSTLVTVHLGIIPINNQIDAQFFSIYLFRFSTCFEQPCAHHQESQFYQYNVWYMSICVGDRPVCRSVPTCIPDCHLHRVTYTRRCIDVIYSPDNERNM